MEERGGVRDCHVNSEGAHGKGEKRDGAVEGGTGAVGVWHGK